MEKLLKQLDELKKRAAAKLAEVKDETTPEAARAIEADHAKILQDIAALEANIAEAQRSQIDPADVATRAAAIVGIAAVSRAQGVELTTEDEQAAIQNGTTPDAFRAMMFDRLAERSRQTITNPARIIRDEAETRRSALADALSFRMGGAPLDGVRAEQARPYMEFLDVPEFAAAATGHRGMMRTVRDKEAVLERAFHSTSDFPSIFSSAINTSLERRYQMAQPTYRRISRQRDFMDFRPHTAVKIGEYPMLEGLTETGEIKFGTFGESKEQIAVVPYAKGIRVSRQMLVNDRLGAIGELLGGYGRTVSRFEEVTFYQMMNSANTKLADALVVFHASHNNLAGAGSAINVAALGAGQAAIRKQKNIDGATINITPSILLVSPDKEIEALQYLAVIVANDSAKVNPIASTLSPVVSAELTGNAWYLFADPEDAPVYQWGYLDGYNAPRIRMDEPFGTQGIGMTVEHDFGVGAIDFRGGYKNPGA